MRHLILDNETTNLIHNSLRPLHKQPRVIEFFGLVLTDDEWAEAGTLHSFLDPGTPISAEVTKITGITQDAVAGKPKFIEFAPVLKRFIEESDVVVAHNLSYDKAVIDFEFSRLKQIVSWPLNRVCTVEATEHFKGHRLNLGALHTELFGAGFEKAHSAEHDVRATARCYVELIKRGVV